MVYRLKSGAVSRASEFTTSLQCFAASHSPTEYSAQHLRFRITGDPPLYEVLSDRVPITRSDWVVSLPQLSPADDKRKQPRSARAGHDRIVTTDSGSRNGIHMVLRDTLSGSRPFWINIEPAEQPSTQNVQKNLVIDPMVKPEIDRTCDGTNLVTNVVTNAKRPHEVGVCC